MTIEHFETRADAPERMFEWTNLLGVCLGDVGVNDGDDSDRRVRYHCDNYRGKLQRKQQELKLHPAAFPPDVGQCFSYTIQGEIRAEPQMPALTRGRAEVMIDRLNLNIYRLKRNRGAVIHVLRTEFHRKKPKAARVKELLDLALLPDATGQLAAYSQTAAHYLTKKLRQLTA